MKNPFKKIPIYVRVSCNKMEVTNLLTGESIIKSANEPFSNSRIVIADFFRADFFLRSLLRDLGIISSLFAPRLKMIIQQAEELEGGLTDIEKRAYRDLGEQAGGVEIAIMKEAQPISNQQALFELDRLDEDDYELP